MQLQGEPQEKQQKQQLPQEKHHANHAESVVETRLNRQCIHKLYYCRNVYSTVTRFKNNKCVVLVLIVILNM